jgi:hypothetical protein
MNCCNDYGQCTRGADCPARPASCDSLGVCQDRTPPCKNCHPVKPEGSGAVFPEGEVMALNVSTAFVLGLALAYGLLEYVS